VEGAVSASSVAADRMLRAFDAFFFAARDSRLPDLIRIGYAALLLVNLLVLGHDLERWFGEAGVLPFDASQRIVDADALTLFAWLPRTDAVLWGAYLLLIAHVVLLLAGIAPRLQAACAFVWLVSFHHRHILLFDGEDTVFRLLCFLLIFLPTGRHYVLGRRNPSPTLHPGWALRLVQLQVCLIYFSSAWEKAAGVDWLSGTALYFVARLDDMFGTMPLPRVFFEWMPAVRFGSWAVMGLEFVLPVTLWIRNLRRPSLAAAFLFHAFTDYSMSLFLFHWIMAVALISFFEPRELDKLKAVFGRVPTRKSGITQDADSAAASAGSNGGPGACTGSSAAHGVRHG
jgi:hypothetical protein